MKENTPTLEEAKQYIYAIDFSDVIHGLIFQKGWLRKHALKLEMLYKNFLYLNKKYGDQYQLAPSKEIDEFWHCHILDTKKYHKDCQAIFGHYLQHVPEKDPFVTTQKLYQQEFGDFIYQVRSQNIVSRIINNLVYQIQKSLGHL